MGFKEHKGLSSQEIADLETELNDIASEYVANGQEMLYQLLSHAEVRLYWIYCIKIISNANIH